MKMPIAIMALLTAIAGAAQADDVQTILPQHADMMSPIEHAAQVTQMDVQSWSPAVIIWDENAWLTDNNDTRQDSTWSGRI